MRKTDTETLFLEKFQKEKAGRRHTRWEVTVVCLAALFLLTACGAGRQQSSGEKGPQQAAETEAPRPADTGFVLTGPESYDSADTAVIVAVDKGEKTVTFLNLEIEREYTLSYDGTTRFSDKYGKAVSLDQLLPGDIVDLTFLKTKKHLTSLQRSSHAWVYSEVERYEIDPVRREVTIGDETYKLNSSTRYFAQGTPLQEMDLVAADVLTFQGIDSGIYSVQVEKGHGYLRLVNDENFQGGWLEIGQTMIHRITPDMLLTVPEGSYQVTISHKGGGGTKSVIINRNAETALDIGDLEVAEVQYGKVLFSLNPSVAQLYIDGEETDASRPVSLEYGLHQLIARAEGYHTLTQYIRVGQATAGLDVTLDKLDNGEEQEKGKEETEEKDNTGEKKDGSSEAVGTGYYKVYVDVPEGAEVYLDGNYVGISPCSFKKVSGAHVITLRKSGYETRSYTVQVDEEEKDISYSFAEMVASAGEKQEN